MDDYLNDLTCNDGDDDDDDYSIHSDNDNDNNNDNHDNNHKNKSNIRKYWVEILLSLFCLGYLYYFLGGIFGWLLLQSLIFIFPFLCLCLFYRVNNKKNENSYNNKSNMIIAVSQNGRCGLCAKILDQNFKVQSYKKNNKTQQRAICDKCYNRNCL